MVKTRFAPSPTGKSPHIGNIRTALYSYLVAKQLNGKFLLRIEDTDKEREVEGGKEAIFRTLHLAGLKYDNIPFIQSEHKDTYFPYACQLVDIGKAYVCICEKDNEEPCDCRDKFITPHKDQPYVIRFKMPKEGKSFFDDEVFGHIEIDCKELDDIVLIKRDGFPTYNFAHVIDDYLMGITHIVRGCEYLPSTPKYVLIYKAFGWQPPTYIHLPLIMGKDENGNVSKLSKRHGAVSFEDLTSKGYLPEAIINYIVFLGWNPKNDKEFFTLKELETEFDIKNINTAPAIFDYDKLNWFNKHYISEMDNEAYFEWVEPFLPEFEEDTGIYRNQKEVYLANLLKTRISSFEDIISQTQFLKKLPEYEIDLFVNKKAKTDINMCQEVFEEYLDHPYRFADNPIDLLFHLDDIADNLELSKKSVMWIVRIALSGLLVTPCGAADIMYLLGRDESRCRIEIALKKLKEQV